MQRDGESFPKAPGTLPKNTTKTPLGSPYMVSPDAKRRRCAMEHYWGLRSPACRALLQMEGGLDGGGRLYPHLQVLATFIVTQLQMTAFLLKAW